MNRFETIPVEDVAADDDEPDGAGRELYIGYVKKIWPRGTMLRCPRCGRVQTASVGEVAAFLERGWPTCCNGRMHVGDLPRN